MRERPAARKRTRNPQRRNISLRSQEAKLAGLTLLWLLLPNSADAQQPCVAGTLVSVIGQTCQIGGVDYKFSAPSSANGAAFIAWDPTTNNFTPNPSGAGFTIGPQQTPQDGYAIVQGYFEYDVSTPEGAATLTGVRIDATGLSPFPGNDNYNDYMGLHDDVSYIGLPFFSFMG
jgi:hypothetical protein